METTTGNTPDTPDAPDAETDTDITDEELRELYEHNQQQADRWAHIAYVVCLVAAGSTVFAIFTSTANTDWNVFGLALGLDVVSGTICAVAAGYNFCACCYSIGRYLAVLSIASFVIGSPMLWLVIRAPSVVGI